MYLCAIFSALVAVPAAIIFAAPVEEGFIASTTVAEDPAPAGFNLTHVKTHQPSNTNSDTNYTVDFHIIDSAAKTHCSITWPASAPSTDEKYTECANLTFSASITSFANISSFALDLDHYYANEKTNIAHGSVTPSELDCEGSVGKLQAAAHCRQPKNATIVLPGGTGVSG
ncbi:MAG: hypothetical protein M1821_002911 [Bathelium mastoideum]|nr:MAG: hypothetical protein M1821_002911 [Bathelium mastoideum]